MGFILLYILVFIGSSFYAYSDINQINQKLDHVYQEKGRHELIGAYKQLIMQHQEINKNFTNWDEVHQQLDNSSFYSFWYTHRLYSSRILPDYYQEAALYDKQGHILVKLRTTTLPETIATDQLIPYFKIENNIAYLILTTPIPDRDNSNKIRGYVTTKSKVFNSLLKFKQFNYIDSESLKTTVRNKDYIPVNEFIEYLSYQVKNNNDIQTFTQFLQQAITRNSIILIGFAILFYFLISFFLSRPLLEISRYIDELDQDSELKKVLDMGNQFHIDELEKIRHSLIHYQDKLKKVYLNLDNKNKELWNMAHHDALTGVFNRRAFEKHWQHVQEIFSDSRQKIALLLFDINHFKSINDTYGHPVGDKVLQSFAETIQKSLRKGEKLYRIGGDEFATIIQVVKQEDALYVAERCKNAIKNMPSRPLKIKEPVVASIGIAHNINQTSGSINDLLWQADVAVYEAKKPGTYQIILYSKDIDKSSNSIFSSKINNIVYDAVASGKDIVMFYQPVIGLSDHKINYYEALLRIKKDNEIILPKNIFELVEARKLEYELDLAIFKTIEADLKKGKIPEQTGVSINISGPSIIHDNIVEQLALFVPYLKHYKIILEITETSLITNMILARKHINALKQQGFIIALDDFGSGYSSISYLSSMPVDIVKFDISLIQQLGNKKQYSIIHHLADMIHETGHELVAEGIETEQVHKTISRMKFHYAQGYLYGKPTQEPARLSAEQPS